MSARTAGRWHLVELLGAGGMGEVWRGESADGAVAAVKLVVGDALDDVVRRRFEREASALLELEHPNVVRAFEVGHADDGAPFLAMELLGGESLDARLRARWTLPPDEVVRIGVESALGLGAAHAHGIVHRDVKPGNLFLCSPDARVKVLDFGLALRTDGGDETRLTRALAVLGTPSYMAPEQAVAERTEDVRTDVWALGAVLHHALAGRPPFWAGGNLIAELFRIVTDPPDALPGAIPPALRDVVGRALQKDPAARFASMAELAGALEEVRARGPLGSDAIARAGPASTGALDATLASAGTLAWPPPLSEENRLVAALVVEDVHGAGAAHEILREIRRRGGAAAALKGGRVVGTFGGAEWRGDEAERALMAALVVAASHGVRVGVGTGKALRAADGATVTGTAVSAAEDALRAAEGEARGVAGGGVVGACSETRRRVEGAFETLGSRVVRARPGHRTLGIREVAGVEIPLLGRDTELAQLEALVDRAQDDARSQAAIVHGPPGIGKSRLRLELARRLARRPAECVLLEGRGESARSFTSHATIAGVVRQRARLPEGTGPDEARRAIEALVAEARVPASKARGTSDFLGELLGVPFPENDQLRGARREPALMADRIKLALGDLFEGLGAEAPLVLTIEDLHWVDPGSLALFEFLLLRLEERPFALVATARSELLADRPDLFPVAERIALRELSGRDTSSIIERLLPGAGRETLEAVVHRAAGNPYFAEELALAVREGADPRALPLTVEAAVQARLDQLEPREKDLLKRAAVLGRRFWTEAVVALGEPDAARLLTALRRRDLVAPRAESRLLGCAEWTIRHAVVHEVALGMLTEPQRRSLSRVAAAWLGARADAAPEEVADHHERAGEPAAALPFWVRAVEAADRRTDAAQVVAFGARALGVSTGAASLGPAAEHALRLRRAEAFFWLGRMEPLEEEFAALETLERAAKARGEPIAALPRAEMRRWRSWYFERTARGEAAVVSAREAVVLVAELGDAAAEARAGARLAESLGASGRLEEAALVVTSASAAATRVAEDRIGRAVVEQSRAFVAYLRGDTAAALQGCRDAHAAFAAAGEVRRTALSGMNVGATLQSLGENEGARAMLEETLAVARSLGLRPAEGWALQNLAPILIRTGETAAGRAAFERALAIAREAGDWRLVAATLKYRSALAGEAGDPEAALADADAAVAAASTAGARTTETLARTARAAALVGLGRASEALEESERALALRDAQGGMGEMEVDLLLAHRDALAALGRDAEARGALAEARRAYETGLARLEGERLRQAYAENVGAHRRLRALLEETASSPAAGAVG